MHEWLDDQSFETTEWLDDQSLETTEWLDDQSFETIEWPSHFSDLNPIENVWGLLKNRILK